MSIGLALIDKELVFVFMLIAELVSVLTLIAELASVLTLIYIYIVILFRLKFQILRINFY